jgi:hypothetical protein
VNDHAVSADPVSAGPVPPPAVPPDAVPPRAIPPDAVPPRAIPPDAMPAPAGPPEQAPGDTEAASTEAVIRRVERASGMLAGRAVARMNEALPWFAGMSPEHRSGIQLVVQAGISSFVEWFRRPEHVRELSGDVFRVAPRELVRAVTFSRLVDLVRVAVEAIEVEIPALVGPEHEQRITAAVLRYSRDIAFAGAAVYARVAEERGALDARLEALVIDHIVRGEVERALPSRAAAVGWRNPPGVTVVVGVPPEATSETVVDEVHRLVRGTGLEVLTGVHSDRLVIVAGGAFTPGPEGEEAMLLAVTKLLPAYGPGPIVVGPVAADLAGAAASARAALSAADAVPAWPAAPRPVTARALLPERALAGDPEARQTLVDAVYRPLAEAGTPLLDTVGAYLDFGASLEATARALYLHPNTVRYRLRKVADVCALDPTNHRDGFLLHVALILGRLAQATGK